MRFMVAVRGKRSSQAWRRSLARVLRSMRAGSRRGRTRMSHGSLRSTGPAAKRFRALSAVSGPLFASSVRMPLAAGMRRWWRLLLPPWIASQGAHRPLPSLFFCCAPRFR
eukprot:Amastigsp_a688275_11.p4 type:complete len:110 gc:universal Amastigsp_a688275_11:677-348(-)